MCWACSVHTCLAVSYEQTAGLGLVLSGSYKLFACLCTVYGAVPAALPFLGATKWHSPFNSLVRKKVFSGPGSGLVA